jgi:hypothetical protein
MTDRATRERKRAARFFAITAWLGKSENAATENCKPSGSQAMDVCAGMPHALLLALKLLAGSGPDAPSLSWRPGARISRLPSAEAIIMRQQGVDSGRLCAAHAS